MKHHEKRLLFVLAAVAVLCVIGSTSAEYLISTERSGISLIFHFGNLLSTTLFFGFITYYWIKHKKDLTLQATEIQRENLRITLNSIGDAIISTDSQGCVSEMNPVAEEMTGWKRDAAKGRPLSDVFKIVTASTGEPVENPVQKVLETGETVEPAQHTALIAKNGVTRQIADSAAPILDTSKRIQGVVLVFRDVSDEYTMRSAMEAEQIRNRHILKGTNAGTWDWDLVTNELIVNERWAEIIGYTLAELKPSLETWSGTVQADDLKVCEQALEEHFAGRLAYYDVEFRQKHRDGTWRWVHARGCVVERKADGTPLRMSGTHIEITDRRKAEDALIRAKEEAEAANKAKDEFLAVMSHEMRTPLNPIIGFSEVLLESTKQEPERSQLQTILNAGNRQLHLIDDILDYMRINRGSVKFNTEIFGILDLCEHVMADASIVAHGLELNIINGDKGTAFATDLLVETDLMIVRRILDNLVNNACKYTRTGSVTLRLSKSDASNRFRFQVEDTGIGIDREVLKHIFKPFSQADSSYTRKHEGVGLGLAICSKLVKLLEGTITVESELGKGSVFTVELPLQIAQESKGESTSRDILEATKLGDLSHACRALIVDDKEDNLLILNALLDRLGATVTEASNGQEALELCKMHNYDLILMDLAMPMLNGLDATRQIRGETINKITPIIAVTADVSHSVQENCEKAGMNGYVSKPVQPKILLREIERIFS